MRLNSYQIVPCLLFVIYVFSENGFGRVHPMEYVGSHESIISRYYAKRNIWNTSNLGTILFKNIPPTKFHSESKEKRKYVILTWDTANESESQHEKMHPFKGCSVKNCIFTTDRRQLNTADVITISAASPTWKYPKIKQRKLDQKWVIYTNEYPQGKWRLRYFASIFNWTMTYRIEADIPIPYGRTVPLPQPMMTKKQFEKSPLDKIIPNWNIKRNDILAITILSHDMPIGKKYLNDLSHHMKVYVCSELNENCKPTEEYFFYLAFQNVRCNQYITEDIFYHSFSKGAIPVILGASLENCEDLLPPQSFIHVDQFASGKELAIHMKNVASDIEAISGYHRWRNHFEVVIENGVYGAPTCHFCRICQALNYNNDDVRIYSEDDIKYFFDKNKNCKSDWREQKIKKIQHINKPQNPIVKHSSKENRSGKMKLKKKMNDRLKKHFKKRM